MTGCVMLIIIIIVGCDVNLFYAQNI